MATHFSGRSNPNSFGAKTRVSAWQPADRLPKISLQFRESTKIQQTI